MTCSVGPKVTTSGLVFEYDMSNTKKSFKGAPSVNLFTGTESLAGEIDGFGGVSALDIAMPSIGPNGQGTYYARKSTSGYATWSIQASLTENVTYTYSVDVKTLTATGVNIRRNEPGVYQQGSTYGVTVPANTWTRVSWTYTVSAGKSGTQCVGVQVGNLGGGNEGIWLANAKLEVGSYATPYNYGTRSTTQALLDVTGLNTITATSLTYASDNTFSFGTTSSAAITGVLPTLNQDVTLVAIVNQLTASGPHQTAICTDKNYCYGVKLMSSYHGSIAAWVADSVASTNKLTLVTGPDIQNAGYKMIALTRTTAGVVNLYLNGILQNSSSAADTGNTAVAGTSWIGMEYHSISYGFNGKIPYTAAYNRALTSDEVLQNFNALRGRYGI